MLGFVARVGLVAEGAANDVGLDEAIREYVKLRMRLKAMTAAAITAIGPDHALL